MSLGSLLDDNNYHEVYIQRERRDISLSVDRVQIRVSFYLEYITTLMLLDSSHT